ncbi:putative amidohydrolase [Halalkaliarchaeum sp. AArc-CO]|uniref:carbon-nitrogen hydrolase family protein n=1 Tax=unclassified Halalkaliarchaeum TaxID=2678344 RepID=UPI00217D2C84|nr:MULTISPECIES: carbon-nitrogen hydrolase family protein [unclassified Halalkaliarchaeum]MDR5671974.1 carbon-nitrogen hydrolase family protein [Halalkaliarchaeum sp. AArc-GB]UWG51479.1 putative amidohydrolase [Halalkaliarchaeum sp. AArc-CO]
MTTPPRVAACGFEPVVGDVDANRNRVASAIEVLPGDVTLSVFPELCVSGYDLDTAREIAAPVPGPLTKPLVEIAASHDTSMVVGVPERSRNSEETVYNSLAYVTPDGVEGVYRKRFLWGEEATVFSVGEEPLVTETPAGTLGYLTCYDLNFPEAELPYAHAGCDLLAVSAAWRTEYLDDWQLLARARAFDGNCYVVASNHTGTQRGRDHAGHSLIAGPDGSIVEETGPEEGAAVAQIMGTELERARERNPVAETRREKE